MTDHTTSNRNWIVRAAEVSDAAEIARIYNHYVASGGATFATKPTTLDEMESFLKLSPEPGWPRDGWFVAESQGDRRLLGWASARTFSDRFGFRHSCETAIYLDSTSVGSGAADGLQQRIEQHCVEQRIHHAVAKIIADNQRSMRFHYRYGYELVGIQKEIGRLNDQWIDLAILQKLFPLAP
ncbi:GNAT family N-acetyltransferase [Stieleria varia]|uniref:N-acyltransferase YncA n=1 Tax=Stieleria varia TaxID=2528005 RepID=A0A5C6BC25_9BACT|nr:GNAT family N-acetyltransferase [Stieleria varia]TWU08084.1 N-acyltransferase YncA [Stieleria varia]